jgi:hypothetical protein
MKRKAIHADGKVLRSFQSLAHRESCKAGSLPKKLRILVSNEFKNDLAILLNYLWDDERLHYMAEPSKEHIYLIMRKLAKEVGFKIKKSLPFIGHGACNCK